MVRIIFLRHGFTNDNKEGRFSGFTDTKLSKTGHKQADLSAIYLSEENIDKIYTSPLSRAKDTAFKVASNKGLELQTIEEFKEMNFGTMEGLTFKEIKKNHHDEYEKILTQGFEYKFPSGESLIDFHERVSGKLDMLIEENEGKSILLVAHSGVIRCFLSHLVCKDHKLHWNFKIDNCSKSVVEVENKFCVIDTLNDTSHLRSME